MGSPRMLSPHTLRKLLLPLLSLSYSLGDTATPHRIIYSTVKAPAAIGPYSQAVQLDNVVYLSGQIGLDPGTMQLMDGVEDQARQALENLGQLLRLAESSFEKVLKATVFLADMNDFAAVNKVYQEYFTKDFPARAAVQVATLPLGARVEIEAVAVSGPLETSYVNEGK